MNKDNKRYQECNRIEKIWRRRHYVAIPFLWLGYMMKTKIYKLFFDREESLNGKFMWRIFVSEADSKMNWVYTTEEVKDRLKELKNKINKNK
jgi:hypothetical protein